MKTVLITGISKGIGQALAQKFIKEGFEVIGTVFEGESASALSQGDQTNQNSQNNSGGQLSDEHLSVFKLDLSSSESITDCADKIINTLGNEKKIDILINNAGALYDEDETGVVIEKLRKTLEVNLIGPIDFTEKLIPHINSGGHIVNISSSAGSLERATHAESHHPYHYPSYKISKTALNMYTCTLALRLQASEITVSSVHPGWVKTDIGGQEAEITPEQAALGIYDVAISRPETGKFWFGKEKMAW